MLISVIILYRCVVTVFQESRELCQPRCQWWYFLRWLSKSVSWCV